MGGRCGGLPGHMLGSVLIATMCLSLSSSRDNYREWACVRAMWRGGCSVALDRAERMHLERVSWHITQWAPGPMVTCLKSVYVMDARCRLVIAAGTRAPGLLGALSGSHGAHRRVGGFSCAPGGCGSSGFWPRACGTGFVGSICELSLCGWSDVGHASMLQGPHSRGHRLRLVQRMWHQTVRATESVSVSLAQMGEEGPEVERAGGGA